MNRRRRNRPSFVALAGGICLLLVPAVGLADGFATGAGQITNIQYGLANPASGTIDWVFDDGFGGPAWQGEAWVEVADSLGGADADYNFGSSGVVTASASIGRTWASAWVDLDTEELYRDSLATIPVDGWSFVADSPAMFDYFSITPADPGSPDPIEMAFSFDYEIHLTGQAEPGAPYYSDASVSMSLEYEDEFGDWQLVPGGQLFFADAIAGSGYDSDDVTLGGSLSTLVGLDPDVTYAVEFSLYDNIPEPATGLLFACGGLTLLRRRARAPKIRATRRGGARRL